MDRKPKCFGTSSCGTEEYEACPYGDECSFIHAINKKTEGAAEEESR